MNVTGTPTIHNNMSVPIKPFYRIEHYMIMNDTGEERTITDKQNVPVKECNKVKLKATRACGFRYSRKNHRYEKHKGGYLECLKFS